MESLEGETAQMNHGYIGKQLSRIKRHLLYVLNDNVMCLEFLTARQKRNFPGGITGFIFNI